MFFYEDRRNCSCTAPRAHNRFEDLSSPGLRGFFFLLTEAKNRRSEKPPQRVRSQKRQNLFLARRIATRFTTLVREVFFFFLLLLVKAARGD